MESYFSFCFIRNPWDHAISKFYELKKDNKYQSLDIDTFLSNGMLQEFATRCQSIYSHQGTVLVKRLYQYENLQEAIIEIFDELNLTGKPQLPQAKANLRTDKRHYREILNSSQKIKIQQIFSQEIEWGSYQFWTTKYPKFTKKLHWIHNNLYIVPLNRSTANTLKSNIGTIKLTTILIQDPWREQDDETLAIIETHPFAKKTLARQSNRKKLGYWINYKRQAITIAKHL